MQDPPTESGRSGLGMGLARFRSAPATWLDALLEEDDSVKLSDPGPHHHQQQGSLTQLLTSGGDGPGGSPTSNPNTTQLGRVGSYIQPTTPDPGFYGGVQTNSAAFHRMNSSPAEFLNANIDGYFSTFGIPSSSAYNFVPGGGAGSSGESSPSGKRLGEHDFEQYSPTFSGQRRGELKTANSMVEVEMEKLLEDSVPCRVRAKRGCATHPRSIAERVRRTRISDRIRKLQELVPNMDKQTNTADMLEEAVEYVKTLQRQIEELTEQQKKCQCMSES